jgi:hypothetical protein
VRPNSPLSISGDDCLGVAALGRGVRYGADLVSKAVLVVVALILSGRLIFVNVPRIATGIARRCRGRRSSRSEHCDACHKWNCCEKCYPSASHVSSDLFPRMGHVGGVAMWINQRLWTT